MQDRIEDNAKSDSLGDRIGERHRSDSDERRNRFRIVREPVDILDLLHHQETDHDQRRRGGEGRNREEKRREEQRQQEQPRRHHGRKTRLSSLGDTRRRFHKRRDRRSAEQRARRRADSVGEQYVPYAGQTAFLVQEIRFRRAADDRSQRVEHVDEQKRQQDRQEIDVQDRAEVKLHESRSQRRRHGDDRRREQAEKTFRRIGYIESHKLASHPHHPGSEDAPKNATLDFFRHQDRRRQKPDQRQDYRDSLRAERPVCQRLAERIELHERRAVHDDMRVLETDEADEKPDTDGNRCLELARDRVKDRLAHVRQRQHDEDDALDENRRKALLPCIAHADNDGEREVRVQSHRRRKRLSLLFLVLPAA